MKTHLIHFEGRVAALATEVGIVFPAWVDALDREDPIWQFIAAAASCAYDVLIGALSGPYTEALGTAYARGTWVGADRFDLRESNGLSDQFPPFLVRNV